MDKQDTINAIVKASYCPLSIIIVGVGDADFSAMKMLDGDGDSLRSTNGDLARRDIVQFVPFNAQTTPERLAHDTLAEIPKQLVAYMVHAKISPQPHVLPICQTPDLPPPVPTSNT